MGSAAPCEMTGMGMGRRQGSRFRAGAGARRGGQVLLAVLAAGLLPAGQAEAANEDRVFTIGNYPVEARAADAVAAKNQAIAEGQQAALRSLLRRIVPVTSYNRISRLKGVKAGDLIDGLSVRSERNSQTEYIASYDFQFQAEAVRRLLDKEGIPFLDRQAPVVTVVPIYRAPSEQGTPDVFTDARGSDSWLYAWKSLDLQNALTPVSLQPLKKTVHRDTIKAILDGEPAPIRTMGREYETETLLIAVLEPELGAKKVNVTLAGRDSVASFRLTRTYRLDGPDLTYTAELAAVRALGVLEGRWKAINVRGVGSIGDGGATSRSEGASDGRPIGAAHTGGSASGDGLLHIAVEFRSMADWTSISRQLAGTPDISDLDVLGLGGRSARIQLRYPGGAQQLAVALASQGLILRNSGSGWLLTQR